MSKTNPARGMRDFLPADVRKRDYVIGIIKDVYQSYGFEPLETPALENTFFVKYIEDDNQTVEAEAITAAEEILHRLGFKDFTIRLNHRQVLIDILDTVGVVENQHSEALAAIENFDSLDYEAFANDLQDRDIPETASEMLVEMFGHTQEILNQENDINRTVVSNLINIVSNEVLAEIGQIIQLSGKAPVVIDPTFAKSSLFYTGAIVGATSFGLSESLGHGGRYIESAQLPDEDQKPAFRFSFNIDGLVSSLNDREILSAVK